MKCKTLLTQTAALLLLLVVSTPMTHAQEAATGVLGSPQSPLGSRYVEDLYKEYAAGTAGKASCVRMSSPMVAVTRSRRYGREISLPKDPNRCAVKSGVKLLPLLYL